MRRPGRTFVLAMIVLTAAACSRHDQSKASAEINDAGRSVDTAVAKVAHNPDVRHVEADMKKAGHQAAVEFRKATAQAKGAAHGLADDGRKAGHDAAHAGDGNAS